MTVRAQASRTILTGQDVTMTATYVYDSDGNTDSSSGWINSKYDNSILQIGVATLNATALNYRVEGRATSSARPGVIVTGSIESASDIDTFITISENVAEVRVGQKINLNSTPNNVYSRLILTEVS